MSFRMTVDDVFVIKRRGDEATVAENIGVLFKGIDRSDIDRGAVVTGSGSDAAPFIV